MKKWEKTRKKTKKTKQNKRKTKKNKNKAKQKKIHRSFSVVLEMILKQKTKQRIKYDLELFDSYKFLTN